MFFIDRLYDDYECHQRRHSGRDELDILVIGATVSGPSWYHRVLTGVGDGLIAAGGSIKKHGGAADPPTYVPQAR